MYQILLRIDLADEVKVTVELEKELQHLFEVMQMFETRNILEIFKNLSQLQWLCSVKK